MFQIEKFNTAKMSFLPKLIINSTEFQCHLKQFNQMIKILSGKKSEIIARHQRQKPQENMFICQKRYLKGTQQIEENICNIHDTRIIPEILKKKYK